MANKAGEIGSIAPDFVLQDQNRTAVSLSDLKGKKVVLSFHPLAWTSVCKAQMQDLEKSKERLDELGAVALGFSVDSVPCKRAWAKDIGVEATSLLADFWPHGGVASAYGIFREADGFSERAVLHPGRGRGHPVPEGVPHRRTAGYRRDPQSGREPVKRLLR